MFSLHVSAIWSKSLLSIERSDQTTFHKVTKVYLLLEGEDSR